MPSSRRAFPATVSTGRNPPPSGWTRSISGSWIPIDGTKSFVRGYPMFSTQIAVMHRGRLELGVSSAPAYGELAFAERGAGAFLDDARLAVSRIARLEEATLSTGNLRSLAAGPRWAAFGRLVARLDRIRGFGDFLHYHLLAAGKIDAVLESDINILDIAALTVIVEEAGGRVTDLEGKPIGLGTRSILATNGALHEAVLEALHSGQALTNTRWPRQAISPTGTS